MGGTTKRRRLCSNHALVLFQPCIDSFLSPNGTPWKLRGFCPDQYPQFLSASLWLFIVLGFSAVSFSNKREWEASQNYNKWKSDAGRFSDVSRDRIKLNYAYSICVILSASMPDLILISLHQNAAKTSFTLQMGGLPLRYIYIYIYAYRVDQVPSPNACFI